MNRYETTFQRCRKEGRAAYIPFWMLGDPDIEASLGHIRTIAESADILELGMPFSDPLADGPTIQASVNRALASGANTESCFATIEKVRQQFPDTPIGLLVYLNLIIAYGIDEFFARCKAVGVDSVLAPELPVEEVDLLAAAAQQSGIDLVFLVSTNTPENRLDKIFAASGGFIYAVSTPSITGAKTDVSDDTLEMITRLKSRTDIPICVGFGVSTPDQVQLLAKHNADGVIIGSRLFEYLDDLPNLTAFCEACRKASSI